MTLNLDINQAIAELLNIHVFEPCISGIKLDSRKIQSGDLFIALDGEQCHGIRFAEMAIENGAVIIFSQTDTKAEHGQVQQINNIPVISIFQLDAFVSEIAATFYQLPTQNMKLIGVTGTNGKTSICDIIFQLSEALELQSAYIGTLGVKSKTINDYHGMTTPDAVSLQAYLNQLAKSGVELTALEVSSHALIQGRVSACLFDVVAFSNLSHDHLDYHGDMQSYFAAKQSLFCLDTTTPAVINIDNKYGQDLIKALQAQNPERQVIAVGHKAFEFSNSALQLNQANILVEGYLLKLSLKLNGKIESFELKTPLLAEFNIDNLLIAIACLVTQGYSISAISQAINLLKPVAGRMECFTSPNDITLVVDFAHTPDGLKRALEACQQHCHGKVWLVFGCGGDRDQEKRSEMGKIASELADHIMLTNDNPRSESPADITKQISQGISGKRYRIEHDRQGAIRQTFALAQAKDWVLIAGKGHETIQQVGDTEIPYNERAFVESLSRGHA